MSEFSWDDEEEPVSEYELVEEAQETEDLAEHYAEQPVIVKAKEEVLEQVAEESAFELDQQESNVIYNARLRLEQAKLYEMLVNHNLFDGVEASPQAINMVQNELKHYIVRRLEILMGLRQPEIKQKSGSGFNTVEVDFLKQLAYQGTYGQSIEEKHEDPKLQRIKPVGVKTKHNGLKTLVEKKPMSNPAKQKVVKKSISEVPPPPPLPTRPVKRKKKRTSTAPHRQEIKGGASKRLMTKQEAEQLALEEINRTKNRKPFSEMNVKEKAKEIVRVSNAKERKPPPNNPVAPMITDVNQLHAKYATESQVRNANPKNKMFQINDLIANALAAQKHNE